MSICTLNCDSVYNIVSKLEELDIINVKSVSKYFLQISRKYIINNAEISIENRKDGSTQVLFYFNKKLGYRGLGKIILRQTTTTYEFYKNGNKSTIPYIDNTITHSMVIYLQYNSVSLYMYDGTSTLCMAFMEKDYLPLANKAKNIYGSYLEEIKQKHYNTLKI